MWCTLKVQDVSKKLNSNIKLGLTNEEAKNRQCKYGKNKLNNSKKTSFLMKFIKQFNDFMIIILIASALVSAGVSYVAHDNDYIDSIIIIGIVITNALMGVIQESKAEKSIEALQKLASPQAKVKRNGEIVTIPSEDIVPGDIIEVETGSYIPADARLINTYNFKVEESALTGETFPVEKNANKILTNTSSLGDMENLIFATTIAVSGHAEAIATEIGMDTKVGKIAQMIINNDSPETPLQKKLGDVGKKLGLTALVICTIVFLIGLLKKIPAMEIFMTSVGLAVAAIPEGLPAVVTIMLSIGITRMAKKNSIIRKLPAVETLGSSNVIASDKTGTLTQNKMKVVEIIGSSKKDILQLGTMCTDCSINSKNEVDGEATEKAIVEAALKIGENKIELYKSMERINDIPFDSERKLMTTIHKFGNKYRIITKGAPDVLIRRCNNYSKNSQIYSITDEEVKRIEHQNEDMAKRALRVIAIAYKDIDYLPNKIDERIENDLTFCGLIGMIDPPREGVKEAIATCKKAGIKTVMITGDHILTAKAIGKELGILKIGDMAITGAELDKLSDKELEKNIMKYSVFARVSPEHKVRIVKAFRNQGNVVAMTGDGVNDAPALKNADIGIAMGITGTDVAKNAADMILTDDNFVTIIEAVKEGRHIYDNIRKAVHFSISTNVGEIVAIFMGLLLGWDAPLVAIQLLWTNLVTDSLPGIALGLEPMEEDIMDRKPNKANQSIFAGGMWWKIIIEGTMIGALTLFAFSLGNKLYGLEVARTMAFFALSTLELAHSFNIKSENSLFKVGILNNMYLIGAVGVGLILQTIVMITPGIAQIFNCVPLNITQWLIVIVIALLPIILMEIQKAINEFRFGRVIYPKKTSIERI